MLKQHNRFMAERRQQARTAPLTPFHEFLHHAMDKGSAFKCLTRNFDGLETRDRPDLSSRVEMLHGDNRVLTCPGLSCSNIEGAEASAFDESFLNGTAVDCPDCVSTCKFGPL